MGEEENIEVAETEEESSSSISDIKVALKEIEKLRKENAKHRTANVTLKDAADKWTAHEDSQKTELERLTEEKRATLSEADTLREENARLKVKLKYGFEDDEFDDLLVGDVASMEKVAKKISDSIGIGVGGSKVRADYFAGRRGNPVTDTSENKSSDELFRQWWLDQPTKRGQD